MLRAGFELLDELMVVGLVEFENETVLVTHSKPQPPF
jgi:hypothetical protein